MSRRFALQIILPIEGYEEDKVYDEKEIKLRSEYYIREPENVFYRRLKSKSVYAAFDEIIEYANEKYQLEEPDGYSMSTDYLGNCEIYVQRKKYVIEAYEIKKLEKEHVKEQVYCNEYKYCDLDWFYSSVGRELVPNDIAIVDDELIQKAAELLEYKSDKDLVDGLADVIEDGMDGDNKFMASLILAKEMANRMNGRAILRYE